MRRRRRRGAADTKSSKPSLTGGGNETCETRTNVLQLTHQLGSHLCAFFLQPVLLARMSPPKERLIREMAELFPSYLAHTHTKNVELNTAECQDLLRFKLCLICSQFFMPSEKGRLKRLAQSVATFVLVGMHVALHSLSGCLHWGHVWKFQIKDESCVGGQS